MKKYIIHLLITAFIVVLSASGSVQAQLSFSIRFSKLVYVTGEPISCVMVLRNTGTTALVVNNRFLVNQPSGPHEVSFQVIDSALQVAPFVVKVNASSQSKKYIVLQPGITESKPFILSNYYTCDVKGKYAVTAFYENQLDAPASLGLPPAWKGRLKSNKVTFTLR